MKKLLLLTALCSALLGGSLFAQDFSNKGKDFWVGYGYHQVMQGGNQQEMVLYFATDAVTTITVEIPLLGYSQTYTNVPANTIFTSNPLPKAGAQDARLYQEGVSRNGIHITSTKPVVAYAHIYNSNVSGATILFPTPTLGKDYYSINFDQVSNSPNANCWVYAVAVDTGITTVEVRPSAATLTHAANVPFTVDLQQGEVLNLMGILTTTTGGTFRGVDLTGTKIRSVTGVNGACKRIAVFSGSGRISVTCTSGSASSDNYMVQAFPRNAWGKKYLTVPTSVLPTNFYRVAVSNSGTTVTVNGTPLTGLINGFYYQFSSDQPTLIEADEPIMVAQIMTSQNACGNGGPGDPEVIYLSPVEQNIDRVILNSTSNFAISQHWINVVIKSAAVASFKLDGMPVIGIFTTHPQDASFVYGQINVGAGQHSLTADSGFNAVAYGMGNFESYGYNAGTNIKDLYQFVTISNDYATVNFPASCVGTPFQFAMTFPYQPTQIRWIFNGLFPDVTVNNPVYDSTWFVNGRQLYRYRLPTFYTIAAAGTYPIKVIAQNPTPDGCGNEQEINYDLQVFDRPTANFNFTTNGCVSDSVRFFDVSTGTNGRPIIKWSWSFGDGATSAVQNPAHLYPTAGSYNAKFSIITDVGCVSDTITKVVNLNQSPVAKFGATGPFCIGSTVVFTDSSITATSSPLIKWYWNFGDGSPQITATTNAPQPHVYNAAGTYNVMLQVETASGCKSGIYTFPVTINAKPTASFTNGGTCLPNGATQFTDASSGGTGFTYLWNFGDGGTSTLQNPVYNYTTAGPFNVTLTVTTASGCVDDTIKVVNTIFAQPLAGFNVNKLESCPAETLNFTSTSTAAASTITEWFWDFGDATNSTLQNPTKAYPIPGSYIVKHWSKSAAGCMSDTALKTITVLPPPLASFTASALRCERQAIQFTSTSIPNGGIVNTTNWYVNGTLSATTPVFNFTPASAGVYAIRLAVTTDKGCTDDSTMNITVNPTPVPDFSMPNVCLPTGAATFNNLTTISDGTVATITYQWSFGDGVTSTVTSPTHNYTSAGPFNVNLIATSAAGCIKDTTKQLTTVFAQPVAVPAAPAEVCLGTAIAYTSSGSTAAGSSVTQWNWTFDDGTTATVQNPSKTFATAGIHTATLTVTSAAGCVSAPATVSVLVNPLPTPRFRVNTPSCATQAISFEDISIANAGNIIRRTWIMGDGTPATDRPAGPFNYTYTTVGTYTVTLQVETDKGCISVVFDSTITVNPLPAPAFGMPESCVTDPFSQFSDSSTIADGSESGFSFLWNFGDPFATAGNPNTSILRNPQHKYINTGVYPVTLTVTSNKGCSNSLVQDFTVNGALPQSDFSINGGSQVCSNDPVTITNSSSVDRGNIVKLEIFWDATGDISNKTTDDNPAPGKLYNNTYPIFYTPASKIFTIRVRAYSGQTCFDDETKTITVNARPDIQFPVINSVCADAASVSIAAAATNVPGTGVFSGRGVSPTGIFNPSTAGAGTHTIRYTFTAANGCTDFKEQTIEVYPVPVIRLTANRTVLEDGSITLDAVGTGNNLSYLWAPPTWLSNAAIAQPVSTPKADIIYTLNVTSADGCQKSATVSVMVLKMPAIPNVFTPNGDNINDTWVIPFLDTYIGATVEIYNRYGQLVYRSKGYPKPWDGLLNGKPLPIGTYYYLINPKNGRKQMSGFVDIIR